MVTNEKKRRKKTPPQRPVSLRFGGFSFIVSSVNEILNQPQNDKYRVEWKYIFFFLARTV